MRKLTKKLIRETQCLMKLKIFLEQEVGLKYDLSTRELKAILKILS